MASLQVCEQKKFISHTSHFVCCVVKASLLHSPHYLYCDLEMMDKVHEGDDSYCKS
jgi:hypothetical protein